MEMRIKEKVDSKGIPLDGIPFHPFYTVHDVMGVGVLCNDLCLCCILRTRDGRMLF
jgi:quinol-cytochrome oxidoreductase complex cytochrome b subunit